MSCEPVKGLLVNRLLPRFREKTAFGGEKTGARELRRFFRMDVEPWPAFTKKDLRNSGRTGTGKFPKGIQKPLRNCTRRHRHRGKTPLPTRDYSRAQHKLNIIHRKKNHKGKVSSFCCNCWVLFQSSKSAKKIRDNPYLGKGGKGKLNKVEKPRIL